MKTDTVEVSVGGGTTRTPDRALPAVINRLVGATETLAAVGLHLASVAGDISLPPDLAERVRAVAATVADLDDLDVTTARQHASVARAMLAQAADFSARPDECATWQVEDPLVLLSLGQASAGFAPLIRNVVAPMLDGCLASLEADGSAILDVGVGVGALAIALATHFPASRMVGLDVWEPALRLARSKVAAANLADRIDVRHQDVVALDDTDAYDLVWFAGPFVPDAVQADALSRCVRALKPGGWLLFAAYGGADPLSAALADLRTLRSGGPVLRNDEIAARLVAAGLRDVRPLSLHLGIPARVIVGQRKTGSHHSGDNFPGRRKRIVARTA